ncbi:hypothetical protein LZ683_08830 [Comamonas testosteroni]|uniref:hypothetical protein n=1 Tax=Comamonas testosteroni TaxID=285 RepID=UPI0023AA2D58|nr:hypothetical protein [Comamonas testosteroni]WEE79445.1 hypothetical protein LZ683_08830 [Comamonas testosteroni]
MLQMNRKPMKSRGFRPRLPKDLEPEDVEIKHEARQQRLAALMTVKVRKTAPVVISEEVVAVPKERVVRSERYRRLVASLPCIFCGIVGYSQHAHENEGKGARLKVDDRRAMPLCCTRPGIEGCHVAFDQYRLLPGGRDAHHVQGRIWAALTRGRIYESGLWPSGVPLITEVIDVAPDG